MFVSTNEEGEGAQELGDGASSPWTMLEEEEEAAEAQGCESIHPETRRGKAGHPLRLSSSVGKSL